jgi:signal transduction histidine kinase
VALELAQVVLGFPVGASFAIAGGIAVLREGRRRTSLNEAMHELRRPLQVLELSLPAQPAAAAPLDSSLRMIAVAVERLDREINGRSLAGAPTAISLRPLVEAAVARWQPRAESAKRPLSLRWRTGDVILRGDEIELAQGLDNLISNAYEHGAGEVALEVRGEGALVCLAVLDRGRSGGGRRRRRRDARGWGGGRSRHGHGLRVVRRAAARHGGSFQLRRSPDGTAAQMKLPMSEVSP